MAVAQLSSSVSGSFLVVSRRTTLGRISGLAEESQGVGVGSVSRLGMSLISVLASWHVCICIYMGSLSRWISKLLSLDFPLLGEILRFFCISSLIYFGFPLVRARVTDP